ncbi:probable TPS1-alpha,alpha-trehalose-phosphate synthase, 56 KD subunit [Serendipita indica DSM 11827]|uniref:alpha,alpha-trehalose-phosphate synthase (UDP-forming) n=1 Tax=Serendipita indica (strain DSM 11827) TaxID=1109443 RepID=G4TKR9_SERID|nr:probable TPS1-alpha,alpha-trehalose-phosphate synthase, 56 KD subunit [Serendipita indica DSM 11827]
MASEPAPAASSRASVSRTHTSDYLPDEMDLGNAKHLIVVSNRLPVTISKDAKGEYHFKMSSGGLVSALSGLKRSIQFTWIGWTGFFIPHKDRPIVDKRLMEEYSCLAVYLDDDVADKHYNGFSNSILWPLFHYHPGEMNFDESHWLAYRQANLTFAEAVMSQVRKGSMVWVQDYHLMLLPLFLRAMVDGPESLGEATASEVERLQRGLVRGTDVPEKEHCQEIKIGFFLHTPFPSSEIYRILPVRREILLGTIQCDLVGFHTYDYARHFLSSCTRILSLPTMPNGVQLPTGAYCQVGTFPIGIDPESFVKGPETPAVSKRIKELEQRFQGVKLIVGVDRLDYIKGVPQKMSALELFLEQHPEWVGKVVLIQLAVPSRGDVEEYQNLRATVNELVGRINGRFGTVDFMPIHFMHKSLPFTELCALYAVSDVCLVTSTRDGMNLVSYEFIATQQERQGVMIISEFAGAAQSLNGSIVVNPWDSQQVADAIFEAVTMPQEVRAENHSKLFKVTSLAILPFNFSQYSFILLVRRKVFGNVLGQHVCGRTRSTKGWWSKRATNRAHTQPEYRLAHPRKRRRRAQARGCRCRCLSSPSPLPSHLSLLPGLEWLLTTVRSAGVVWGWLG